MNPSINFFLVVLIGLISPLISFGQEYELIDYECLESPFTITNANHDNTIIYCVDGLLRIDTMEQDCYEFYTEEDNIFRGWYYNAVDEQGTVVFDFDHITFHHNDDWGGATRKYFELQRAGFWLTLPSLENEDRQFSLELEDLTGQGVNIGFSMEDGASYFPSLQEMIEVGFPGLTIDYSNDILTVQGPVRNVFIGGDHLYFGQLTLSEVLTFVNQVEDVDVRFFPNPTTVELNVRSKGLTDTVIEIYTAAGVRCATYASAGEDIQVDISDLPSGVFWVQVWKDERLLHTESIVKL